MTITDTIDRAHQAYSCNHFIDRAAAWDQEDREFFIRQAEKSRAECARGTMGRGPHPFIAYLDQRPIAVAFPGEPLMVVADDQFGIAVSEEQDLRRLIRSKW